MINSRDYNKNDDYNKVIDFLSKVYRLNQSHHSWLPARWEYATYLVSPLFKFRGFNDWETTIRIWETNEGEIVGIVNSENPDENAFLQIHPDYRLLEEEMIDWAEKNIALTIEDNTSRKKIAIWTHDHDTSRQNILNKRGYQRQEHFGYFNRQYFDHDIPEYKLPEGYSLRSFADGVNITSRSECAAKAFHSSEAPLEVYNKMQTAPSYRSDLDLVTVFGDTTVTSLCTVWFDKKNRIGVFEPVATHPEYQRKGLGKAVLLEGLRRLKALGAEIAYVSTYGSDRETFYNSAGFQEYDTYRPWVKEF